MMKDKESPKINESAFKHLINHEMLKRISYSLKAVYPCFQSKYFENLMPNLETLEMKSRINFLRDVLYAQLPQDFPSALEIILNSLKQGLLKGIDIWPFTSFVQTYGLGHIEVSLCALKEMTKLFTSEWAIRPFIKEHPEITLKYLLKCAKNKDVNVRRWASEGTRSRLPWGERLHQFIKDPQSTQAILECLKYDQELFVRKSVANHLNDLTKDNPAFVLKLLQEWKKFCTNEHSKKIDWITRHALRNLIKAGDNEALKLVGVSKKVKFNFTNFKIDKKKIKLEEKISFEFGLRSQDLKSQKFVVDYAIYFVKANNTLSPKVFKLKTLEIPGQGEIKFKKTHHFKTVTTRKHYAGAHLLEIQVNGTTVHKCEFEVSV